MLEIYNSHGNLVATAETLADLDAIDQLNEEVMRGMHDDIVIERARQLGFSRP